ncbi:MAG: tRNA-dihydrouridine synthase [Parachlamydia sp.]|nr:tRNA-dihydrouridine synthase [Parachlamydia sp.]
MGALTSVAPGHIPQVKNHHLPTGFLRRLIHDDVNATFKCLQQVANATENAFVEHSRTKDQILEAHNLTVAEVDRHANRINALEAIRNGDVEAANQTARVVDGHTGRIDALCLETHGLGERVRHLEEIRERDRQSTAQTVAVVDQHSQQILEAQRQIGSLQQARESSANRFTDMAMNSQEMALQIQTLFASREEVTAMVIRLEREIDALGGRMDQIVLSIQQLTATVALFNRNHS